MTLARAASGTTPLPAVLSLAKFAERRMATIGRAYLGRSLRLATDRALHSVFG